MDAVRTAPAVAGARRDGGTFDVIVVGAGGAGLAAAIEAQSLGRSTLLLEKAEKIGGTTGRSVGSVAATNTSHQIRKGIKDSPEEHLRDLGAFNAKLNLPGNPVFARMLVENVPDTFRWLEESGLEFFGPMTELPHRKQRMHNVIPDSRAYPFHLGRRARKLGVDIRTAAPVEELILEDGRVVGVVATIAGRATAFRARGGVVLSCGDYSADGKSRARHISPTMANVTPVNPYNTGDGHRMVEALGGRIINGHLHLSGLRFPPPPPKWYSRIPPYRPVARFMRWALENLPGVVTNRLITGFLTTVLVPSYKMFHEGAILVNARGERFTDETRDSAAEMGAQPDQKAYILLDGPLARKFSGYPYYVSTASGFSYASMEDYRQNRKDIFHEAPTLAGLAGQIGVPAAALEQTLATLNAERARDPKPGRPELKEGPYVALGPVRYYINFTDGGLAVNERLEVLGAGDRPVPGLYAAGLTGMGGVLLEGHGHHLGWVFTSGRIAARHAAYRVTTADLPEAGPAL
ncbi:FAD-dependent oxidoreductase [Aquabacter spiritensis]|uniref:Fumarate reductase flavoprotein subunit/urocanate reductase n=1 Tax=Aquabacter spiritensis TaxID=933073 RepID=A0A4R3LZV2_9HYPH|nr:FAD-dependent oxidoreductase [Aquabacter spiritensis]TCT06222.1 fumarate reductase flavoprotein subunit/urocanate reductase [Aquabacter spiritensis]